MDEVVKQEQSLEEFIAEKQEMWNGVISSLSDKMKDFANLPDLQYVIFSKRQDCVDYYYYLVGKVSEMSVEYKKRYAERYNFYKTGSPIRYTSDSAINSQIDADLRDYKYKIDRISNLTKYMQETVKTIDGLIYAISNRIHIEELIRGVKY